MEGVPHETGGGGGGGEGDAFPSCLVFDRAGGKFGYGRMIPGATCTSVMYSPSNNDEVADIMSLAAKKSKMSHAKGGSATENLNTVLDYDVYGMETETDLNGFMKIKEVKTKYKFLAKKWHPDVQNENQSKINKDKFINITNAYKIILESLTKPAKN